MYVRKVTKKNNKPGKSYQYYRLIHAYRIGDKTRQKVVLNLGKLEELSPDKHKLLADRIEELLTGASALFSNTDPQIEKLARHFSQKIIKENRFSLNNAQKKDTKKTNESKTYLEADISSAEEIESRNLGGEWMAKQAFTAMTIDDIFSSLALENKDIAIAKALLTAKMVHPGSELETERWLNENSSAMELYGESPEQATRYRLYKVAKLLYDHKENIESKLYEFSQTLFAERNKIVIFDLTNMHFEGKMAKSAKAKFGRSKQKRSDCRLISLALSIDSNGFVRGSEFWKGAVSEPDTLKSMIAYVENQVNDNDRGEKPLLVFDAGITTDDNLEMVRGKFDYICVSRSIPEEYKEISDEWTKLRDNENNEINIKKVETSTGETMLLVSSELKRQKEQAIEQKLTYRLEQELQYVKEGLSMPRRMKKIKRVQEKVGRIRQKYPRVSKCYIINYNYDDKMEKVTDLKWEKRDEKAKPKGKYFLRYSKKDLTDKEIWDGYNLTREVEASFRCLKSDLKIRPIFHQKDAYIEQHIWLGIMAYQVVNYLRTRLKNHGINYSWSTIVEKLKTQRMTTTTIDLRENKKAVIQTCTRASKDAERIYDALNFKERPFTRKTDVVTQL